MLVAVLPRFQLGLLEISFTSILAILQRNKPKLQPLAADLIRTISTG
jgi:hypothetical protein